MQKHARKRAYERHGISLHKDLETKIVKAIQAGDGEHVETQSNSRTKWRVNADGKTITVIYDKNRGCLVTVLPNEEKE